MTVLKTISIETLRNIDKCLASRIELLASQLENTLEDRRAGNKASYWVDVEMHDSFMHLLADNGHDISESIRVPVHRVNDILVAIQ